MEADSPARQPSAQLAAPAAGTPKGAGALRASTGIAGQRALGRPLPGLLHQPRATFSLTYAWMLPGLPGGDQARRDLASKWIYLLNPDASNGLSLVASDVRRLKPLPPSIRRNIDLETLWLARCIFSETKRPEEQELVAWVVRNRVDTEYRAKDTYRDVVLDPLQFSAFNEGTSTRDYYSSLTPHARVPGWQEALRIAYEVQRMPSVLRPFSPYTRHFYSEQSMVGSLHPEWAKEVDPVTPRRNFTLNSRRFRFFEYVA